MNLRSDKEGVDAVKPDPFTAGWWMPLILGGYAWQVHNWWIGLLAFLLFIILAIGFSWLGFFGPILRATRDDDPALDRSVFQVLRTIRRAKWIMFIVGLMAVAASGMVTCSPDGGCRSVWG